MQVPTPVKKIVDVLGLRFCIQRFLFNLKRNRSENADSAYFLENKKVTKLRAGRPIDLLVVTPWADPNRHLWEIAGGNYFFEIFHSAKEYFANKKIENIRIGYGDSDWKYNLLGAIRNSNPKNILIQVESDPDGSGDWTIDSFAQMLKKIGWNGRFFLLTYDSVFPLHMFRIDRVTRIFRKSVVISIDRYCRGYYRARVPNIGPAFLPLSEATLLAIQDYFQVIDNEWTRELGRKFTFVGAEYDYRRVALTAIRDTGLELSINPQNRGSEQASYLKYALALHSSLATLNFSRAHVIDVAQVKSRVIEAMLFQCVLVTDEGSILEKFFEPGVDFLTYSSPEELLRIYQNLLSDKNKVEHMKKNAFDRAIKVNKSSFWGEFEKLMD